MPQDQTKLLLQQCLRGERLAQYRLYDQYVKAMYNTALRIMGNEMDAQDVVQEGFIKAFKNLKQYRFEASFGAWLKRIVVNTAMDSLKKRQAEWHELNTVEDFPEELAVETAYPDLNRINQQIIELPKGCRIVLSLYLVEGYPQKDISTMLGISLSTVKTQYRRGRLLLKDRLKALPNER